MASKSSSLLGSGGSGGGITIASADDTVTNASAVALVRHGATSEAAMSTQLLLQILSQHLDKRKLRRFIGLVNITAIHVHQPDIGLQMRNTHAKNVHIWYQGAGTTSLKVSWWISKESR